jgi:hypothetical protein
MHGHLRAYASPLIRKRPPNLLRAILVGDHRSLPPHLQRAWKILREAGLSAQQARILVHNSVVAGYECAYRLNERAQVAEVYERSSRVKAAFARLSRCATRAPAKLRRLLDEKISAASKSWHVDVEVIEDLLVTATAVFEQFSNAEAARTAFSALGLHRHYGYNTIGLINDFSSLSAPLQENSKLALSRAIKKRRKIDAAAIFKSLASGLAVSPRPPRGASDIVIAYVATVAAEWRSRGLRPGRAFKESDSSYIGKFHRFCDLVLTGLFEPASRRHLEDLDRLSEKAWARQRQLPRETREYIRGGLPRKDSQWLVSAHCLREGLRLAD